MDKQRLSDITQLAKSIFIENARHVDFTIMVDHQTLIAESFEAAEAFLEEQEKYAIQSQ